jgi:protein involved in polysaccharide export with SLBB domain
MIVKNVFLAVLLLVSGSVLAAKQETTHDDGYRLGSGDIVSVNVYGEEGLTFKELPVSDAGFLSFPLIGNVAVKGRTTTEVTDEMVTKLKSGYLTDPQVSVNVVTYRPFYINGEVKKPGGYPYKPGMTVDNAISMGEGLTERGSSKRVTIKRAGDDKEVDATTSTKVGPGDTVKIDQGFF